jgi:hypothetical protein
MRPSPPSLSCTMQAVEGKNISGVTVPTMMASISAGLSPRWAKAFREASTARSLVATPLSTMWRSRIPTRAIIHSLLVSTIRSRSAFVRRRGGTYVPRALILARIGLLKRTPDDECQHFEGLARESLTATVGPQPQRCSRSGGRIRPPVGAPNLPDECVRAYVCRGKYRPRIDTLICPAQQRSSRRESRAYGCNQQQVTFS